jgi:thiol-disulfide isomerase/thioredoxin
MRNILTNKVCLKASFLKKTIKHKFNFLLIFFVFPVVASAVEIGMLAPEFDLIGSNGNVHLSEHKGKVVYLDFWASWCGPCVQSFPWMNDIQSRYGSKGLQIIAINLDQKPDDAKKFLADHPAKFQILFDKDGVTPKLYGIKGMPSSFLISKDGQIKMIHAGFRGEQKEVLEKEIKKYLLE